MYYLFAVGTGLLSGRIGMPRSGSVVAVVIPFIEVFERKESTGVASSPPPDMDRQASSGTARSGGKLPLHLPQSGLMCKTNPRDYLSSSQRLNSPDY